MSNPYLVYSDCHFHAWDAFATVDANGVNSRLVKQIEVLKEFLATATPSEEQSKDIDFLLIIGELFTLVAYGQLILENKKFYTIEDDLIDQIFDFMVRDFSKYALQLYSKPSATSQQMDICLKMIRKPVTDMPRFERVWHNAVFSLRDAYEMKP